MMTHDNGLWKSLCLSNEKGPAMPEKPVFPWEVVYMGNPHVPNDFKKIGQATVFARQSSCKPPTGLCFKVSSPSNVP